MLDIIKKTIFKEFKPDEIRWLFLSTFTQDGQISLSNGVLESDKKLDQLVDLLYHWLFEKEKNISTVVIDVVTESYEEKNMQNLLKIPLSENWVCLVNVQDPSKSGVLLPNTKWVETMQQALQVIKWKYGLVWNVGIYVFKSKRLVAQI